MTLKVADNQYGRLF